jgi:hypothetical protein
MKTSVVPTGFSKGMLDGGAAALGFVKVKAVLE